MAVTARRQARWRIPRILLVEDDAGDQEMARRALQRDGFESDLRVVGDGKAALDYLFQRGSYAGPEAAPRPHLVLLDLNLPGVPGKDVLGAARADPALRRTPFVVVTTSARSRDILDSYELGCNAYVIKPLEAERFIATLREIYNFWFSWVALPEPAPAEAPAEEPDAPSRRAGA